MDLFINNPGFLHISASIFESLDNQSLCKSRLVCKNWLWFIDQRKFIWKRCLQIKIDQVKPWLETNQDWAKIIENIFDSGTVEDLKAKSLYRSCAGSHFYGTEYEIWADFGPIGNTEKNGSIMSNFKVVFFIFSWAK